ncbi:hypothetical protein DIPPA_02243 [Diplonema papillatum]|nr:hypothetical protein DIPPA_02243 [Diplonema papillatum]
MLSAPSGDESYTYGKPPSSFGQDLLSDRSGMTPRRVRRRRERARDPPTLAAMLSHQIEAVTFVPPEVLFTGAYTVVIVVLMWSVWSMSSQASALRAEASSLAANPKVQDLERTELLRLVMDRLCDDYTYILDEANRALNMDNVSYNPQASTFAYNSLLPQLYTGLELINNISRGYRADKEHTMLLQLASANPSGIGSPEWTFKHDSRIRRTLGQPLRHASSNIEEHAGASAPRPPPLVERYLPTVPDFLAHPTQGTGLPEPKVSHLRYILIFLLVAILVTRAL